MSECGVCPGEVLLGLQAPSVANVAYKVAEYDQSCKAHLMFKRG